MDRIDITVKNLNKKGFHAKRIADKSQLLSELSTLIPKDKIISSGGSMTLKELGVLKSLSGSGYRVISSETLDMEWETICKKARTADYYLTSTNALTVDGTLVNIDGRGNRVSNMIYGIENVIVVSGINKITDDLHSALDRIKNVAAPKNCVRLGRRTPCAVTGKCGNCDSPDRICRSTVIHEYPSSNTNTYIYIVDMELGY